MSSCLQGARGRRKRRPLSPPPFSLGRIIKSQKNFSLFSRSATHCSTDSYTCSVAHPLQAMTPPHSWQLCPQQVRHNSKDISVRYRGKFHIQYCETCAKHWPVPTAFHSCISFLLLLFLLEKKTVSAKRSVARVIKPPSLFLLFFHFSRVR